MIEFSIYTLLVLLWGVQLKKRSFSPKILFRLFLTLILVVTALEIYLVHAQYQLWLSNDLTKHLLPPYQNLNYLFFYSFKRLFGTYLISLAISLIVFFIIKNINARSRQQFFYADEPYLAAISIFLLGYPLLVPYLVLIFFFQLILTLLVSFSTNFKTKIPFRFLWVPTAIFVIIISVLLPQYSWWSLLVI